MRNLIKQTVFKGIFFAVCFVGQSWSVALAGEGRLILPMQVDDNVALLLQDSAAPSHPSDALKVFVGDAAGCCDGKFPIAGTYHIEENTVTFDPAFGFVMGQSYTVLTGEGAAANHLTEFVIEPDSVSTNAHVIAIYPSGDEIPENTLRFYIHFSEPMQPHMSDKFIRLVDANGAADFAAFMTFKQELWNEDRTRLTLLMDPGRIKRGVAQNLALGPALLDGNRYSIVIEEGWPSARSGQEAPHFEKSFLVSQPLRSLPDTSLWQFKRPRAMTGDPLVISFDRPFDRQLAHRAISVRDAVGQVIAGTVLLEEHETVWRFQPDDPWTGSSIHVVVDADLEDVAGNNFRDLLDHKVGTDIQSIDQKTIILDLKPEP